LKGAKMKKLVRYLDNAAIGIFGALSLGSCGALALIAAVLLAPVVLIFGLAGYLGREEE